MPCIEPEQDQTQSKNTAGQKTASTQLAPTATTDFALACEEASLACMDACEREAALDSLVSQDTTGRLPQGSRHVGSTERLVVPAEALVEEDTPAPRSSSLSRRRLVIGAAGAAVLIVGAAAVGITHFVLSDPPVAAVEALLRADTTFMKGFAASSYVESSTYELSSVAITQTSAGEHGERLVQATAVLKNKSFSSDCMLSLAFARTSVLSTGATLYEKTPHEAAEGWSGVVLDASATTRAIAGVTQDAELGGAIQADFDADAQRCIFEDTQTQELWFGERKATTPYTYRFDGTAWQRTEGAVQESFSLDAEQFEGSYQASSPGLNITSFTIANCDAQAHTFSVEYVVQAGSLLTQEVSGMLSCTCTPQEPSEQLASYRQADGKVYVFEGSGTSTSGAKTAKVSGVLAYNGAMMIDLEVGYTKTPLLFGSPTNETQTYSGTLKRTA